MKPLVVVCSLAIAALLAVAAARMPTEGAVTIERRVAIEAPAVPTSGGMVERLELELPPPAAPVPVITPTPGIETSAAVDIGWEPPVDCGYRPEQAGC